MLLCLIILLPPRSTPPDTPFPYTTLFRSRIANDTSYCLSSYVQTGDPGRAKRVARQLRSGMVQMNGAGRAAGSPFGGYKQSGYGRGGGKWGLEDFLEVKAVSGWPLSD